MCGVVGFWHKDEMKADSTVLQKMVDRLKHRGPDDNGIWVHQSIGLGHTRLSILDLTEKGHQPFVTQDGQGVISYNGEIYNFSRLHQELEAEGIRFKSASDTEVLLYALHHWGPEQAILRLDGMFSFAYFDLRTQTLWLSRDRAGIKPLYWADQNNITLFASEMKALFDHPALNCRADMHSLTTQIIFRRLDGDWTPFESVKCVLPGSLIKITREKTEIFTYFDLLRDIDINRIIQAEQMPFDGLLQSFEKNFLTSVQSHLVSDAPLATMCSGGLDSSLMTVIAREIKQDLVAYVADVEGVSVPEAEKAQLVCRHAGVPLRKIKITQNDYLALWPQAVYSNDQPNFFPQNIFAMMISKAARKDGFKVLLAGEGSDELFGGYAAQAQAYKMWRLRRLHSMFIPNNRLFRTLGRYFGRMAPLDLPALMKQPFTHLSEMSPFQSAVGQHSSIDGLQRRLRVQRLFEKLDRIKPLEHRAFLAQSFEDFYTHLRTLLCANDKMAMHYSIEARFPFLSNSLIDFGLHLDLKAKYHNKIVKHIVKKAAEKYLPSSIVHAEKVGFGYSDQMWANGAKFLKGGMVAELFKWGAREEERIYQGLKSDPHYLFVLISVELWARIYLKHENPDTLAEKLLISLK